MLDQILQLAQSCWYDFRSTAWPQDPLAYRFDESIPYYRTKWAIARTLLPGSILEVGAGSGYSAMAFLDACPTARYLGIDPAREALQPVPWEALRWARQVTRSYRADFVVADLKTHLKLWGRFPGDRYSLIQIGGQFDEETVLRYLELALAQSDYVLLDASLWNQTLLPVATFLHRYRDVIEFFEGIGGLSGDLLIKPRAVSSMPAPPMTALPMTAPPVKAGAASQQLRDSYTHDYYLFDCGGYDSFKRSHGARLEDVRLHGVVSIARSRNRTSPGNPASPGCKAGGRALDLGCGRGEIAVALARGLTSSGLTSNGYHVTAVDYSPAAIELAQQAADAAGLRDRITFQCGDVNTVPFSGPYDVAVASDLIEHLTPAELDALYRRLARYLANDGALVVHTFPNRWFYQYEHARKWKAAQRLGAYLPRNPRSRYEQLMHINEQSPRVLRRQLGRFFPYVSLWFGSPWEPAGSLARKFSKSELRAAPDLFAVASHQPIDLDQIRSALEMRPLPELAADTLSIEVSAADVAHVGQAGSLRRVAQPASLRRLATGVQDIILPHNVRPGARLSLPVTLTNRSGYELRSLPPNPVHLCYHWLDPINQKAIVFEGERTRLYPALPGYGSEKYGVSIQAPWQRGEYLLRITLVQEGVRWFDSPPANLWIDRWVVLE